MPTEITYAVAPPLPNEALDELYFAAWPSHRAYDFAPVLAHSLTFVAAYAGERLVGFVYFAWDGKDHAFVLEPTVHRDFRRRGIGRTLVEKGVAVARERGLQWVHVDFEADLEPFYRACGFRDSLAGVLRLRD